ncbi:hypothetical protein J6590_050594, partial [Homalodisca vitripennis]
ASSSVKVQIISLPDVLSKYPQSGRATAAAARANARNPRQATPEEYKALLLFDSAMVLGSWCPAPPQASHSLTHYAHCYTYTEVTCCTHLTVPP